MLNWVFWGVALVLAIITLLPLTNSVTWWVRMWDFPRVHIAGVALLALSACLPSKISLKPLLATVLVAVMVYQGVQIFPYTPLARTEIEIASAPSPSEEVSLLSVNVLMENARHHELIAILEREDPDVLLLMETDETWNAALSEVLGRYPTVKSHIADDHYGLIFATRLETSRVELLWPVADDTPAVRAVMASPGGTALNFIGLHPRPPVPGNTTAVRDKQIKDAALMTQSSERPTIVMGDFNDVAWSWTTRRFKRYGNLLEPRIGRGMIASFHADYPFIRLPIDQLFITKDVGLVSFRRLEKFGSDHFPIAATVFLSQEAQAGNGE
ncbi:endonuclease/exonuclease/phosphatase family protein [Roseobacter sp. YSTF-M11]|uniref:Endonuclease/exonuclease/phosphatase family protein n=1 Tax=Roseobacter insulae TaxID=2859783 RepID=A0A9X1FYT0_9RHOB|nr:endonuclease/exonuclease/phosphatase family protein [Roseobacter insulae]MBW4709525.1 endonuclease/exonuclease/phosphatase family protein [Roseobacter insulae]